MAIALVSIAGAVASCSTRVPRTHTISIRNFTMEPRELAVAVGDTVVWSNADFVPHTATARDTSWDSKSIGASAAWRFVATTPGRHEYYCVFHPTMTGVIDVR
jgi:plastocyanin